MRICLVTNRYPAYTGDTASPFVGDFHRALQKRGIETFVFTPEYGVPVVAVEPTVYRFHWAGSSVPVGSLNYLNPVNIYRLIDFIRQGQNQLLYFLQKNRIDYCLALWALPSGYFAYRAWERLAIPYSVWCLGSDISVWAQKPLFYELTMRVLKNARRLYADGFELGREIELLSGRRCHFLPSARRLPQMRERSAQDRPESRSSAWYRSGGLRRSILPEFLYVGRLEKAKGIPELLAAFEKVTREIPCRLTLVGWGSLARGVADWIASRRLQQSIAFSGPVGPEKLVEFYRRCACVVIPSRSESIPLVLSEAVQSKKPVIVTEVGDLGSLVRRYQLGWVIPPGNSLALAQALREFAVNGLRSKPQFKAFQQLINIDRAVDQFLSDLGLVASPRQRVDRIDSTSQLGTLPEFGIAGQKAVRYRRCNQ